MRIAYLTGDWPPERIASGVLTTVDAMASGLRSLGHDALIVSLLGEPRPGDAHVRIAARDDKRSLWRAAVNRMPVSWHLYRRTPQVAARALAAVGPDIVEIEESYGWAQGVASRIDAPVVVRLHGPHFLVGAAASDSPPMTAEDKRRRRFEKAAITTAAQISAPSQFVLDRVRAEYGAPLDTAEVIPNPAPKVAPGEVWTQAGADPDEILFVGRFCRVKGADIALKAFERAARSRPRLRLNFVGPDRGLAEGGKTRSAEAYVAEEIAPDVAKRIRFLGRLSPADIAPLRRRAALTIVSSRVEMFGMVALEGAAFGAPIAATAVGGLPEMLEQGASALLTPPAPEPLGDAIAALVDNPDLAARLGAAARARATTAFALETISRQTVALYEKAIKRVAAAGGGAL